MSSNKWVRSISFNRTNPDDIRRLNFIGKKSFSKFVKKLIDEEMKRQKAVISTTTTKTGKPEMQQRILPSRSDQTVGLKIMVNNKMLGD